MIKHIVLFKFNPETGWDDPAVLAGEKALLNLEQLVPEVKTWFYGRNFSTRPIAYDYALIVELEDRAALQRYIENVDHQRVIKILAQFSHWNIADIEF